MRALALILILLGTPVIGLANEGPTSCEDVLQGVGTSVQTPTRSLRDNWPALVSRLKPTYQSASFDVRVLSAKLSRNTFSPAGLRERVVRDVEKFQDSYRALGFQFRSFVQVLVEAHPHAMGHLGFGAAGKIIWNDTAEATPWVGNARELIGIPNLLGQRSLFVGRADKKGFEEMARFLVLPAVTDTYHSVQNRFVISHELAHETENPKSHQDLMWKEARADFLAFMTTGHTDVVFPEGLEMQLMREDGSIYKKKTTKARSLAEPTISSSENLWPNLGAYHHNSQILSSALYEMSQTLGPKRATEFVHWMDQLSDSDAIPKLHPKPTEPDPDFVAKPNTEYVDHADTVAVRTAIQNHLSRVGQLFRRWSTETGLAANEKAALVTILVKHGL